MKKKKIIWAVFLPVILLTLCFIFGNSMQTAAQSTGSSDIVIEKVEPVLEPVVGEGNVTVKLIRKLAHFCEFALLGAETALLLVFLGSVSIGNFMYSGFFGLLCCLCDETIQLVVQSGRSAEVLDVWIDYAGYAAASLAVAAVYLIIRACRRHKARA